jgi:hypothetical protein
MPPCLSYRADFLRSFYIGRQPPQVSASISSGQKKNNELKKKAIFENVFFYFFFVLDTLSFFGVERHKFWKVNCVKMTNSASEWT